MSTDSLYSVLVADDELPSRQYVCELIEQDPRFQIVSVCDNGESTVAEAQRVQPNAAFIDIQMPGMNGFEVLESLHSSRPLVIFVTAYGDYALKAFEYEAFDYVKKPIDPSRFSRVLDRIDSRLSENAPISSSTPTATATTEEQLLPNQEESSEKKLLSAVREDLVYQESEVQLIESAGNYVNVRIRDESYLVRESLESFYRNLESPDFVRVHRSYVVNVQWVRKMRYGKSGSAQLFLADGHTVPVSRSRRKEVTDILRRLVDPPSIQDDYTI